MEFFRNITAESLKRALIIIECAWALFGSYIYYSDRDTFFIYAPFFLVVNLLTLLPFPYLFRKLREGQEEDILYAPELIEKEESPREIDPWDQVAYGFYVVTNTLILALLIWLTYIFQFRNL